MLPVVFLSSLRVIGIATDSSFSCRNYGAYFYSNQGLFLVGGGGSCAFFRIRVFLVLFDNNRVIRQENPYDTKEAIVIRQRYLVLMVCYHLVILALCVLPVRVTVVGNYQVKIIFFFLSPHYRYGSKKALKT